MTMRYEWIDAGRIAVEAVGPGEDIGESYVVPGTAALLLATELASEATVLAGTPKEIETALRRALAELAKVAPATRRETWHIQYQHAAWPHRPSYRVWRDSDGPDQYRTVDAAPGGKAVIEQVAGGRVIGELTAPVTGDNPVWSATVELDTARSE